MNKSRKQQPAANAGRRSGDLSRCPGTFHRNFWENGSSMALQVVSWYCRQFLLPRQNTRTTAFPLRGRTLVTRFWISSTLAARGHGNCEVWCRRKRRQVRGQGILPKDLQNEDKAAIFYMEVWSWLRTISILMCSELVLRARQVVFVCVLLHSGALLSNIYLAFAANIFFTYCPFLSNLIKWGVCCRLTCHNAFVITAKACQNVDAIIELLEWAEIQ